MVQKLVKYGNSIAVVIPRELAESLRLSAGAMVDVKGSGNQLVVRPVEVVPVLSSDDQTFVDSLYKKRKQVFQKLAE